MLLHVAHRAKRRFITKANVTNFPGLYITGSEREFKDMKLATPVSEGWLFSKDKDTVKIFGGYDVEADGSIHFSERSVFPTSCVLKMTKIHS